MANKKISELPSASAPTGVELLEVVQGGINKQSTSQDIANLGLPPVYTIDQVTTSVAGGTITLDMNSQIQRSHVGSATFATAKAIALSNTTNSMFFNFFFEVTNVAAVLTVPSDWLMSTDDFDGTDWTPPATGKYEIGGSFDDLNNVWYVKLAGPFV
jgi:hypothetical protein